MVTLKLKINKFRKSPGDEGIFETVRLIKGLVEKHKKNMNIRNLSARIVKKLHTNKGKFKALFNWLKQKIKYVRDIEGVETLTSPLKTLILKYGDCDDLTILSGSMLKSIGYPIHYVIISNRPDKMFNHIFLTVSDGRKRYIFDLTAKKFNTARRNITRKKVFE